MDQSKLPSFPWQDELESLPVNPAFGRMGLKVFTVTQTLEDFERGGKTVTETETPDAISRSTPEAFAWDETKCT